MSMIDIIKSFDGQIVFCTIDRSTKIVARVKYFSDTHVLLKTRNNEYHVHPSSITRIEKRRNKND